MQTTFASANGQTIGASFSNGSGSVQPPPPGLRWNPEINEAQTPGLTLNGGSAKWIVQTLIRSRVYLNYVHAFSEATGLALALRPVESWQLPLHGMKKENHFCSLMAGKSRTCAACLELQQRLSDAAATGPQTRSCVHGLSETAVPVVLRDQLIGFLQTGQIFLHEPSDSQYEDTVKRLGDWGVPIDWTELKRAYFQTPVLDTNRHESLVKLLTIFAQHLSMVSNQILIQQETCERPVVAKAKEYIRQHHAEELSLGEVAKAVNTSSFYFCKLFKKATGINYTAYLSRIRIEKASGLLLNPKLRISEIAYEVGFRSLPHFNRVFKKLLGQSPTRYRARLA